MPSRRSVLEWEPKAKARDKKVQNVLDRLKHDNSIDLASTKPHEREAKESRELRRRFKCAQLSK